MDGCEKSIITKKKESKYMMNKIKSNKLFITLMIIATMVLVGCATFKSSYETSKLDIINPYADVNWETYSQHKANLHTHTRMHRFREDGASVFRTGLIHAQDGTILQEPQEGYDNKNRHPDYEAAKGRGLHGGSDGSLSPPAKIDAYQSRGYTILALTDHNVVTWPWQDYGRDPESLGMLAVQGCEPSRHHHMGSYFNDSNGPTGNVEESIRAVGERNGLAVLFHPGRYKETDDWYVELYEKYEHLIGLEVYNQGDRYPNDRELWDRLLTQLMPYRPVWGASNDDAHSIGQVGRNWQVFLLPELNEQALRYAMRHGHSFFSYAPLGHPEDGGDPAPVIQSITVKDVEGTIEIKASGYESIEWISAGQVIAEGHLFDAKGHQGYVRAQLIGETGRTYTQPFFIGDPKKGTPARKTEL